jgi:hypothetical protein
MDYSMIALALGVEVSTLRQYLKDARRHRRRDEIRPGDMPEPDATLGRTPVWRPETIEAWIKARPGRGVGGAAAREQLRREQILREDRVHFPHGVSEWHTQATRDS